MMRTSAFGRRAHTTVRTTAIRIVDIPKREPSFKRNNKIRTPLQQLLFGTGIVMASSGVVHAVLSGRASRQSIGLMGAGSTLLLANSPYFSPAALAGLIVGLTGLSVLSIHLHDERERSMQVILKRALEMHPFPEAVRVDDGGPEPHAVSRPKHEVVVGPLQALLNGKKEEVKVRISGYSVRPDGGFEEIVAYAIATREPLSFYEWTVDKVEGNEHRRIAS